MSLARKLLLLIAIAAAASPFQPTHTIVAAFFLASMVILGTHLLSEP